MDNAFYNNRRRYGPVKSLGRLSVQCGGMADGHRHLYGKAKHRMIHGEVKKNQAAETLQSRVNSFVEA